jgi:hypothetical protein
MRRVRELKESEIVKNGAKRSSQIGKVSHRVEEQRKQPSQVQKQPENMDSSLSVNSFN